MFAHIGPMSEIGLRHALEDGLAIVRDGDVANSRREEVLVELADMFSGARRGMEIVRAQSLFVQADDKPAFEAFAMIFRYLNSVYGEDLSDRIAAANEVLDQLKQGDVPAESAKGTAAEFLCKLLEALKLESAFRPLRAPMMLGMA